MKSDFDRFFHVESESEMEDSELALVNSKSNDSKFG